MKPFQKLLVGSLFGAMFSVPIAQAADPYVAGDRSDLGLYLAVSGGWNYADSDNFEVPSVPMNGRQFRACARIWKRDFRARHLLAEKRGAQ
jgi:hypothetical protein